jgi:ADP-dependent NAD(P)H-hydrate dehydratase / NAD(P)H-hydrate epimerase
MKIFSAEQIREWDKYTIEHEPISSIDLMERAGKACTDWLLHHCSGNKSYKIFCGKGNNGGDGLVIARLLSRSGCNVSVYILETDNSGSADFKANLQRLKDTLNTIHFIKKEDEFPLIDHGDIIVDALFGTGLNKPLSGLTGEMVNHVSNSGALVVSIDIPSGLFADSPSKGNIIVKASHTLTLQQYKLALLMAENEEYFGKVSVINIGLHDTYQDQTQSKYELVDLSVVKKIYRPRKEFSHKGTYGHALLLAGSYGMMGAAVLAAKACLRSGAGKLTTVVPDAGYEIMQISVPEAMCTVSGKKHIKELHEYKSYDSIGIGPGIGLHSSHSTLLQELFEHYKKPMVIDADALNTIAEHIKLLLFIPPNSILTPHPKEFDKLFGESKNDFERIELAAQRAKDHNIYIVLKGHHTFIAGPEGVSYFNSTGNAGMATAGSGDVLTGILTSLLAQHYSPLHACLLGVYLHGLAGDIAAERYSQEGIIAGDIIECLPDTFK